jgi:hypothetical protein
MSGSQTFTPQLIGQTEKALNAFLYRELAGPGLTEHQWIVLTLTVMLGGAVDRHVLLGRVADGLKVNSEDAAALIGELTGRGLLEPPAGDGGEVRVTDAGTALHARIRAATGEIVQRLWGDLPADDLAAAGRLLSTILERANAELLAA